MSKQMKSYIAKNIVNQESQFDMAKLGRLYRIQKIKQMYIEYYSSLGNSKQN